MALSPTSRATWSRLRASCPSACPPSTASCSGASGSWRRKVGSGGGLSPTGGPGGGRAGAGGCAAAQHLSMFPGSAWLAQQRGGRADGREGPSGGDAAGAGPAALSTTPRWCRQYRGEESWGVWAGSWWSLQGVVAAGCSELSGQLQGDLPSPSGWTGHAGGFSSAPPPLQAALRRFHSLSVSSDTTLDSFASLHPDEVRGRQDGVGVWAPPGRGAEAVGVPAARRTASQGP